MPIVSVIIINYNTYTLTTNCLRSIFEKVGSTSIEVILVDNSSTELDPFIFKKNFPKINLIISNRNLGFAGGNNLGISHAKGEYVLLLNSDTELINYAIDEAYRIISCDNTIGVLSGRLQYPTGKIQTQAERFPELTRELRELFRLNKCLSARNRSLYYLGAQWDYSIPVDADWVWGAFFMFKKSDLAFFPNGKLHDTFFMYGEDVQWCYYFKRVLKKRVVYHPAPNLIHYIGGSDKSKQDSFDKYEQKMLPHEYYWMSMVKGIIYTRLYYLTKSILYFSFLKKSEIYKGQLYFKIAFKGIN